MINCCNTRILYLVDEFISPAPKHATTRAACKQHHPHYIHFFCSGLREMRVSTMDGSARVDVSPS